MTIFNPPKLFTRSLIGAMGLSAIAFCGVAQAQNADIVAGIDFLFTPADSDTRVDFDENGPMAPVFFTGVPVLPGGTDTAVERLDDCTFDPMGKCTVGLQFENLNLVSRQAVPEFGDQLVFLMLDPDPDGDGNPDEQPISEMTLMDIGNNMATWTNTLDFNWKLVDSLTDPEATILARGMESFIGSGKGTLDDDGNFTVLTYDDEAAFARHTDQKIPEPSTTLGLLFLGLGVVAGLKRKDKAKK